MFNKEDKIIADTFGKGNPFSVPDGYFDDVNSRIMRRVSDIEAPNPIIAATSSTAKTVSIWLRYRKAVIGAAACACVCVFSLGAYLQISSNAHGNRTAQQADMAQQSEYSSFDAMVDYSMIDTQDMYAYMTDAQ